jgi:hypothetical protein
MELGGGARLFLQSLLHSAFASVLLACMGYMFEMVQLLAGTNLASARLSVLIFDILAIRCRSLSLALFGVWRRSDSVPKARSACHTDSTAGSGLGPTIGAAQRKPRGRSKSSSWMTVDR